MRAAMTTPAASVGHLDHVASELWQQLGPDGCLELRRKLQDIAVAARREAVSANLRARPRSSRRPSRDALAAKLAGCSERALQQAKSVERWAPDLLPAVADGSLVLNRAYGEAMKRKQAAKSQPPPG